MREKGFTIMELMIVMAIVGILFGLVIGKAGEMRGKKKSFRMDEPKIEQCKCGGRDGR